MKIIESVLQFLKSRQEAAKPLTFVPPVSASLQTASSERSVPSATEAKTPAKSLPERPPGNFYSFEFFIELEFRGVVNLGYPKVPLRDMRTGVVRWGSSMEWSWPDPAKTRARWQDDAEAGLLQRSIEHPEDALGAEGSIGEIRLTFDALLDKGENQVVYALYCPEKQIRLAYGFDRTLFEPTHQVTVH
ncbi:hypothetical protein HDF16_004689 [Granulicella aggregans]|uniref:Uncharacterized protein n=1 Tax=Granulicella aggregans TaxID=474949 RepID=A0A7W7ZHD5_9BACT|nr:hypothetical protein [Granulicella aggregans]MBB5059955.1 hypothetical protein [Granulicella aggregans]